jgi:predicted NUDIX family phosphoesterase
MGKHPEEILVVPAELVAELVPAGYSPGTAATAGRLAQLFARATWMVRDAAEADESFRQVIPYTVFRGHDAGAGEIFAYVRARSGGEGRLHDLRSVGVGGHVDYPDLFRFTDKTIAIVEAEAAARELREEVAIQLGELRLPFMVTAAHLPPPVGLLNDPSDPVGRVHLGVVRILDVPWGTIMAREEHLDGACWWTREMVRGHLDEFESWSRLLLDCPLVL